MDELQLDNSELYQMIEFELGGLVGLNEITANIVPNFELIINSGLLVVWCWAGQVDLFRRSWVRRKLRRWGH